MQSLKVDVTKLITQAAYAKKVKLSPSRISQMVKAKELKTVPIIGGVLILLD